MRDTQPPDDGRACAARAATYHLQLTIDSVEFGPGEGVVSGRIARVFRGPGTLRDTRMTLRVPCAGVGDDDWAPDDIGRIPADLVRVGRVLEAYVDATQGGCEIPLDLYAVIDHTTDGPQLQP